MTRLYKQNSFTEDSINIQIEYGLAEGLPRIAEILLNAPMIIERCAEPGNQSRSKEFPKQAENGGLLILTRAVPNPQGKLAQLFRFDETRCAELRIHQTMPLGFKQTRLNSRLKCP